MKIWVLGSQHRNADNCIEWTDEFPYFPNCDILMINTCSIYKDYFNANINKFRDARRSISEMLMVNNKKIIVILGGSIEWLPVFPILTRQKFADIEEFNVDGYLKKYLENVKVTDFRIESYNSTYFFSYAKNMSKEAYDFANNITKYSYIRRNTIKNKGNYTVGGSIIHMFHGTQWVITHSEDYKLYNCGEIIFLPPPSEILTEDGIDILLDNILGIETKEIPPNWVNTVMLPNLEEIEASIYQLYEEIQKNHDEITKLDKSRLELIKYRKLLWAKGIPLENIVMEAFKFLGFTEIRRERSDDLEDGIFDFQTTTDYEHGILEVKGSDKRTALAHLTQCNKWVEDYMLEDKNVKGIFIPNQFRLQEYLVSADDRSHFEPNEKTYAETRNICILPAFELFKAVCEKMNNNPEATREKFEERFLSTNGICRLI